MVKERPVPLNKKVVFINVTNVHLNTISNVRNRENYRYAVMYIMQFKIFKILDNLYKVQITTDLL